MYLLRLNPSVGVIMAAIALILAAFWLCNHIGIEYGWIDEPVRVEYYQEDIN